MYCQLYIYYKNKYIQIPYQRIYIHTLLHNFYYDSWSIENNNISPNDVINNPNKYKKGYQ